MMIFDGILK